MDCLLEQRTFIIISVSCQQARLEPEYSHKKKTQEIKYKYVLRQFLKGAGS